MIHINNRNITGVYCGSREVTAVYLGYKLIWSKITEALCCYSNGYWDDRYPWLDTEFWNDQTK